MQHLIINVGLWIGVIVALVVGIYLLGFRKKKKSKPTPINYNNFLEWSPAEVHAFTLINDYRIRNGLDTLISDKDFYKHACQRSVEISVLPTEEFKEHGHDKFHIHQQILNDLELYHIKEILYRGTISPKKAVTGWKNSPSNRNILKSNVITHVGIGTYSYRDETDKRVTIFTAMFGRRD